MTKSQMWDSVYVWVNVSLLENGKRNIEKIHDS